MALFALAMGGGSIAYVPLLTVLLPLKITGLMGNEDIGALASVTFFGAIIASLANIVFGTLSDRTGSRTGWIISGLALSSVLLFAIGRSSSLIELIALVMVWQIGLNMMLAPLFAWAGDCFPDDQKGMLGGLLAIAPAMGALAGSLVTFEPVVAEEWRIAWVAFLVMALVLPAAILGRNQARAGLLLPSAPRPEPQHDKRTDHEFVAQLAQINLSRATLLRMWLARFLVQISEAGLFAFLLFWLRSIVPDFHENTAANTFSLVLIASVPITLWVGRWSDLHARPIRPLVVCACLAAAGLCLMALANGLVLAIAGYVLFGISATIFLALHTGQTLRVLPKPQHRGRDLGIFNLTNTVPSLVMPWLTLTLVPAFGFDALFALFAVLALLAAGLLAMVPKGLATK